MRHVPLDPGRIPLKLHQLDHCLVPAGAEPFQQHGIGLIFLRLNQKFLDQPGQAGHVGCLADGEDRRLRREIVLTALKTLRSEVTESTLFRPNVTFVFA